MVVTGKTAYAESRYIYYLKFAVLLLSVSSIQQWLDLPVGNTFFWWLIYASVIYCFFRLARLNGRNTIPQVKYWMLLLSLNALYAAFFMSENYWDWKNLISNLMIFSMPLAANVFYKKERLSPILKFWLNISWILFLFLAPFMSSDAFGRFLVPYSFLALFFPLLNKRLKVMVLLALLITIYYGMESRSDMIKFGFCMFLGCLSHWKNFFYRTDRILRFARLVCFVLPFVFVGLGIVGIFNLFQIQEELKMKEGAYTVTDTHGEDMDMLGDTRTFLYTEVLNSAIKNKYVIQGRSIARGYDQSFFSWMLEEQFKGVHGEYRADERAATEVSILNIFNYFGLIGVFLYLWVFVLATKKAMYCSQNIYIKVIGLYVVFRWMFAFIEDFSRFDLNMLFLWIMIGMCYSPYWRNMNDRDIELWIKSL